MPEKTLYEENISSSGTEALFASLTILLSALLIWRTVSGRRDLLSGILFLLAVVFAFYVVNYRTLRIHLSERALTLRFGVFAWRIPVENIADCKRDALPKMLWYGGAGIHFMLVNRRYRASFNFLDHPRVVVALKKKVGPVRDISFTTRCPEQVIQLLQTAAVSSVDK